MKNLIFTLVILGSFIIPKSSEAQHYSSEFVLNLYERSIYVVVFDRKIYDVNNNQFRLSNVSPGNHRLIVKQRIGGPNGAMRKLYEGSVQIPRNSTVYAKINRYNRFEITSVNRRGGYNNNNRYYNDNSHRYRRDNYYNRPLLDLPRLLRTMENAGFESDKKLIAEQAISSHRVKAIQVYRILTMFSFESTKLKIAKFAYGYCIDKNNYYLVNDAFSFSSSIRELNNYIGNYRSDYYDDGWRNYDYDDNYNYRYDKW